MKISEKLALFAIGGAGYVGLELLWRGWSHGSMFLAGGTCFLFLGRVAALPVSSLLRAEIGAVGITAVELAAGLLVNREFRVWDYRSMPGNFLGQVCLPYTLLWIPVAMGGMVLYRSAERLLRPQENQSNK